MKTIKTLISICFTLTNLAVFAQVPDTTNSYTLIFDDEFNGSSVDGTKWESNVPWGNLPYLMSCRDAYGHSDTLWGEYYYTNFLNCTVSGGTIKMTSKKQTYKGWYYTNYYPCGTYNCGASGTDTCWCASTDSVDFKYTTARLFSKQNFKYGYIEIRAKLPTLPTPPASYKSISTNFWLFSANDTTAWSEIDIYEINSNGYNYTSNLHYQKAPTDTHYVFPFPKDGDPAYPLTIASSFKTYAIDWRPNRVDYYIDGQLITTKTKYADKLIPMPLFIDMAVGASQFCEIIDTVNTVLPYTTEVDYVRIYQRKTDCNTNKTYCNNIASYDSKLDKSITFDGTGCTDAVIGDSNFTAEATDYILMDVGFSVDNNSTVLFNVTGCFTGQVTSSRSLTDSSIKPFNSWYKRYRH